MEKQVFLDRVRQTLLDRGVAEEVTARQLAKLSRFIDEEGGDNAETMLEEEDPVLLAEEICTLLKQNAARRAAAAVIEPEEPAESVPVSEQAPAAEAVATVDINENFDMVDLPAADRKGQANLTELSPESIYVPPDADAFEEPSRKSRKQVKQARNEMLEVDEVESRAEEYSGEKGGPMFWVMFIASLPFVAAICAVVLALFIAAFAALAVLQIGAFAALVAVAAAGTAFTLVALIYGIVQLLSSLPVGLFELGIGISAGGVVLFCSILLYNLGVRLLPFTMKQLAKFLGWTAKRGKILFIYLKGACAKL